MNKNRDQYRRLFPTQVFELFVAVGNFQRDINAYRWLTDSWNSIPLEDLLKIKQERLQSLNPKQEPTRFIRDYGVYECLGSGAFGSVYRVARRGTNAMCALKEVRFIIIQYENFIEHFFLIRLIIVRYVRTRIEVLVK